MAVGWVSVWLAILRCLLFVGLVVVTFAVFVVVVSMAVGAVVGRHCCCEGPRCVLGSGFVFGICMVAADRFAAVRLPLTRRTLQLQKIPQ